MSVARLLNLQLAIAACSRSHHRFLQAFTAAADSASKLKNKTIAAICVNHQPPWFTLKSAADYKLKNLLPTET